MPPDVNTLRTYDSSNRRESARRTRERVVAVAWRLFVAKGYAATTVAAIAVSASVSVETVYKAFGTKAGLVRAIRDRALEGQGDVPAEWRSDIFVSEAGDGSEVVMHWSRLSAEVAPRVAPILLLVRSASGVDPEMAAMHDELNESRLQRMRHNARALHERGFLRGDITVDAAGDVMFAYTAPELYELLVLRQRWPLPRYAEFIRVGLTGSLLSA